MPLVTYLLRLHHRSTSLYIPDMRISFKLLVTISIDHGNKTASLLKFTDFIDKLHIIIASHMICDSTLVYTSACASCVEAERGMLHKRAQMCAAHATASRGDLLRIRRPCGHATLPLKNPDKWSRVQKFGAVIDGLFLPMKLPFDQDKS